MDVKNWIMAELDPGGVRESTFLRFWLGKKWELLSISVSREALVRTVGNWV